MDESETKIQLNINGKLYTVSSDVPATTSLLEYIRYYVCLTGTKRCCAEGGCGACTVVATFTDPETSTAKTCSVKSCQTLVRSCNRWVIETVERLGDRYRGYHHLEKALVGFYGTQCGFCSPGFIMTAYGELKSSGSVTQEQVEKALDGNLCRCTGYRPILDAFKSISVDASKDLVQKLVDIEDSYKATCPKTGKQCQGKCSSAPSDTHDCSGSIDPQPITAATLTSTAPRRLPLELGTGDSSWFYPLSLSELYTVLQNGSPNDNSRLVVGNTGQGVYKDDGPFTRFIDTKGIYDLYTVAIGNPLVIGANISLQRCIAVFREMAQYYNGYQHLELIATHWEHVANLAIRNVSSWAGNLMLKHKHREFPSDLFVTLIASDALITVGHSADSSTTEVSVEGLMGMDMSRSVILSMKLPPQDDNTIIRTYKVTPRAVNAHAYVNAAFKFNVNPNNGFKTLSKPTLVFGGISPSFVRASMTETFLHKKKLSVEGIILTAMEKLGNEVVPDSHPVESSPAYRISLCQALLYKAVLNILGDFVSARFRNGGTIIERPLSRGQQSFDLNKDSWPVGKAIPKIESNIQVAGEAEYVDDMDPAKGELHAAFVQSTVANATIDSIDPTAALNVAGVTAFVEAKDIPGLNSFFPLGANDPVFVSDKVSYAGQPVGLIVAESRQIALEAAKLVNVSYTNVQKPILTIKEADTSTPRPFTPIDGADHTVAGEFEQGSQYHFSMELLTVRVIPIEDGYDIFCSTQWPTNVQAAVSAVLGIKNNSINMSVRRLGGAYGAKISRSNLVACAAAVAAHKLQKPVRIALDINAHMTLVGWRDPYLTKYKVGFNNDGTLVRVEVELISDAGFLSNESSAGFIFARVPNVYHAGSWGLSSRIVNTNTAANTHCRAPGTPNAIASMENIVERVAAFLNKDPAEVREKNFLDKTTQTPQSFSPRGENLVRTRIFPLLKQKSDYDTRRAEIKNFNRTHRWKKKGISMVPLFYDLSYPKIFKYNTQVAIYGADGTVVLSHGGIEMGQGLNTKAVQVAAKVLGIPVNSIKVKPSDLVVGANSLVTGGSYGSDLIAYGIQRCCEKLIERMNVVKQQIEEKTNVPPSWIQLVQACLNRDVDLSERFWTSSDVHPESYDIFAAACMEVELDVLTGQFLMRRSDIVEDVGRSISPYVDIGQIEGAFVMGLGFYTSEIVKYDPDTGEKLTNGTWTYKIPSAMDIPADLRVTILPRGDNQYGVQRSKATGEPAVCLGYSVVTALRQAISSAREDAGNTDWFEMSTPMTVEKVQQLCMVSPDDFVLQTTEARLMYGNEDEDFHVVSKTEVPEIEDSSCLLN